LDDPASPAPVATPPATTKYYFTAKITGNNLITNGDFSNGNTGFSSTYTFNPVNKTAGEYFIGSDPSAWNPAMAPCKDHSGNGNMLLVNGSQDLNVKVWSTTVSVQPNTTYAFSSWLQSISPPNPATLQFSINGQLLG